MENRSIMSKVCLILIVIVFSQSNLWAQKFTGLGDTIVVYIDNQVEIKIAVGDYSTFNENHETYKILMHFHSLLPGINSRLDPEAPDKVTFNGDDKLEIEKGDLKYQFLLGEDAITDTGFRDIAVLSNKNAFVKITTTDLFLVRDMDIQKCLNDVISMLPEAKNNSRILSYECKEGSVSLIDDTLGTGASIDMLGLTAGTGASLIKNNWVVDLSAEIFFSFNRKGVLRYNPYLSANLIFDFDSENNMKTNTMLNLGYRWNQDKTSAKPDWLGVEVGFLVHQNGDFFGKNTFKLGLNWSLFKGRSVYVSPQLYFTDNFNTIYPAVRIGFGL